MKKTLVILSIIFCLGGFAQHLTVPKNEFQLEIGVGHSFPSFEEKQDVWKGTFYPAGHLSVGVGHSFSPQFQVFMAYGISGYALVNKSEFGRYVLDFASPMVLLGVRYYQQHTKRRGYFYRLSGGAQLGYRGTYAEQFQTYSVFSESSDNFYSFVRPEIGMRFTAKNKLQGHKYKYSFEVATFFRYNFNRLGTATFQSRNSVAIANPKGDVIGLVFRYVIPYGTKRIKQKSTSDEPPIKKRENNTLKPY